MSLARLKRRTSSCSNIQSLVPKMTESQFLKELITFHASHRTPISNMPTILGKRFSLLNLFLAVLRRGGSKMVTESHSWPEILGDIELPYSCTHSDTAIRRIYQRYLESYERNIYTGSTNTPGIRADLDLLGLTSISSSASGSPHPIHSSNSMLELRDSEHSFRVSSRYSNGPYVFQESVPVHFRHSLHDIPAYRRPGLGLTTDLTEPGELQLLEKSLHSGLPNEIEVALSTLLILSRGLEVRLDRTHHLLELLLACVGIFDDGPSSFFLLHDDWKRQGRRNFFRFWYDNISEPEDRIFLYPDVFRRNDSSKSCNEPLDPQNLWFNNNEGCHASDQEWHWIYLVAAILRNLVQSPANARYLAANEQALRFLLLCSHTQSLQLKNIGREVLSHMTCPLAAESWQVPERFSQEMVRCVNTWITATDRAERINGFELLSRLSTLEENATILSVQITDACLDSLISSCLIHDVHLLVSALDALCWLSNAGKLASRRLAGRPNCLAMLLAYLSREAQSLGTTSIYKCMIMQGVEPSRQVHNQMVQTPFPQRPPNMMPSTPYPYTPMPHVANTYYPAPQPSPGIMQSPCPSSLMPPPPPPTFTPGNGYYRPMLAKVPIPPSNHIPQSRPLESTPSPVRANSGSLRGPRTASTAPHSSPTVREQLAINLRRHVAQANAQTSSPVSSNRCTTSAQSTGFHPTPTPVSNVPVISKIPVPQPTINNNKCPTLEMTNGYPKHPIEGKLQPVSPKVNGQSSPEKNTTDKKVLCDVKDSPIEVLAESLKENFPTKVEKEDSSSDDGSPNKDEDRKSCDHETVFKIPDPKAAPSATQTLDRSTSISVVNWLRVNYDISPQGQPIYRSALLAHCQDSLRENLPKVANILPRHITKLLKEAFGCVDFEKCGASDFLYKNVSRIDKSKQKTKEVKRTVGTRSSPVSNGISSRLISRRGSPEQLTNGQSETRKRLRSSGSPEVSPPSSPKRIRHDLQHQLNHHLHNGGTPVNGIRRKLNGFSTTSTSQTAENPHSLYNGESITSAKRSPTTVRSTLTSDMELTSSTTVSNSVGVHHKKRGGNYSKKNCFTTHKRRKGLSAALKRAAQTVLATSLKTSPIETNLTPSPALQGASRLDSPVMSYLCEWHNCNGTFATAKQVSAHAYSSHLAPLISTKGNVSGGRGQRWVCQWSGCEQASLPRAGFSLISHVIDWHCSEPALQKRIGHNSNAQCPPGLVQESAWTAIRRGQQFSPNDMCLLREGPVTKHMRITAALTLRNLATYSNLARSYLRSREEHLCELAMSGVDASSILGQCLAEISLSREQEDDSDTEQCDVVEESSSSSYSDVIDNCLENNIDLDAQ